MNKKSLFVVFLIAGAILSSGAYASLTGFPYVSRIEIDTTSATALVDFPVLLKINTTLTDQVDCDDLWIYASDNTTKIDYEFIDKAHGTYGCDKAETKIWARCPSCSNTTVLFAYTGNSSVSTGENKTGVWNSSIIFVAHTGDNTTSTISDSTVGYLGTKSSANNPIESSGHIVNAQDYGATNEIDFGDIAVDGGSELTVTAWINRDGDSHTGGIGAVVAKDYRGAGDASFSMFVVNADDKPYFRVWGTGDAQASCSATVNDGSWDYLAGVYDSTTHVVRIFLNGADCGNDATISGNVVDASASLWFGDSYGDNGNVFDGEIEEVRIYNLRMTNQWLKMEHDIVDHYDNLVTITIPTNDTVASPEAFPNYSANTTTPGSPQTYGVSSIWFNISWSDDDGDLDDVWIIHNFSGSTVTYVMSNDSASHFYHEVGYTITAGGYEYQIHANDSSNNLNATTKLYYTINKASTTINLSINGTQDNVTDTYPYPTNTTGWKSVAGGTLTLLRNGSSKSNPETLQLGAGIYNYTLTLSHENYTASAVTRFLTINQASSGLSLTASPDWTIIENSEVTITCSATFNSTLYREGVIVTSPHTIILPYGYYNFTCAINDQANYTPGTTTTFLTVESGGFGCSDTNTFAFEKNFSVLGTLVNLNFTILVENSLVKSDLSDVRVITNNTTSYINGSHLVVDITNVTDIVVRFGNYITNYIYSNNSLSANTSNVTGYTEINNYYVYTFIDETTGNQQLPPNSTQTLSMYCLGGSSSFTFNHTRLLVASFIELDETRASVEYSATEMYYRTLINTNPIEYRNFYLVDAEQHQVVEIMFTLQDYTYNYNNGYMRIKKYLEGTEQTITEAQFDLEDKVITYLINGDKYSLYIDSEDGVYSTNIGLLTVDTIDLTKTVIIGNFSSVDSRIGKLYYNLTFDAEADTIRFFVSDPSGSMSNVSFWVYNTTNTSHLLYFASSSNASQVNFNYNVPDNTSRYKVEFKIAHDFFGLNSYGSGAILGDPALSWLIMPYVTLPANITTGFSVIIIIASALIFGSMFGALGGIIAVIVSGLMVYFGMIEISATVLAVAMFFALGNKVRGDKRA